MSKLLLSSTFDGKCCAVVALVCYLLLGNNLGMCFSVENYFFRILDFQYNVVSLVLLSHSQVSKETYACMKLENEKGNKKKKKDVETWSVRLSITWM